MLRRTLGWVGRNLDQLDEATLNAVVGNVGSVVVFQSGAKDGEFLAEQLGSGITASDICSLPKYTAYVRLLVDGIASRAFSMATLPPTRIEQAKAKATESLITRVSREFHASDIAVGLLTLKPILRMPLPFSRPVYRCVGQLTALELAQRTQRHQLEHFRHRFVASLRESTS